MADLWHRVGGPSWVFHSFFCGCTTAKWVLRHPHFHTILHLHMVIGRLVPRSQKGLRSWVRWVQGLGPWWILDLARPFCRGTLETQDLKILICSETLKTQDLKILIVARPWKPRTLKFGYVAKPWKPRTQNLEMLMSRDLKVLGPYTIQYKITCWALCQGVQQVINSDDRTPKTWILKNNTTYRTHPVGGRL